MNKFETKRKNTKDEEEKVGENEWNWRRRIGYCRYEEERGVSHDLPLDEQNKKRKKKNIAQSFTLVAETEISNRNAPVIFTATFLILINNGWIWNQRRNESVGKRRLEGIAL